ncbi:MAG: hypothetical protein M0R77_10625 [Gammaproteobacteria bacterium]|nr:hypothetical protein [Gammaproteobacteria bacterium]
MKNIKNALYNSSWQTSVTTDQQISLLKEISKKMDDNIMKSIYSDVQTIYDDSKSTWYCDYESSRPIKDTVSRSQHNSVVKDRDSAKEEAADAKNTIHALTDGNEEMQRALIKIDPHNIRYIENPYVSVQLDAIMADPNCFTKIKNPAQEAIDMYRIVK